MQWAYALRREKSVAEARRVLGEAVLYHPAFAPILFNLACYACAMGDVEFARELLPKVFAIDNDFKDVALDDEDLEPIFGEAFKP